MGITKKIKEMAIITLLTDFGLEDAYVGIVKGVILSINPSVTIVDISHNITPQDLVRAAYLLETSYRFFAPGTLHVVVVDPGVGGGRSIVGVEVKGHRFLAPDNGVLTAILAEGTADRVVRVENSRFFLDPVSRTFHGRDIFAPVAAHLSMGLDLEELGPVTESGELMRLRLPQPAFAEAGEIIGVVVTADRFGNLVTNIRERDMVELRNPDDTSDLIIQIGGKSIRGISDSYSAAAPGRLLAIMGSTGRLEISVNCGNASRFCKAGPGGTVRIKRGASIQ